MTPVEATHRRLLVPVAAALALASASCARQVRPQPRERTAAAEARRTVGLASWYGGKFHGRKTASGERFDKEALTAAHRTLPFGACVEVENLDNGRRVKLRVNDRGPYAGNRIIDVSEAAARRLDMIDRGVAKVAVRRC